MTTFAVDIDRDVLLVVEIEEHVWSLRPDRHGGDVVADR